jgi:hypothetical protein
LLEFNQRGQDPLHGDAGYPRDVDIIGDPLTAEELAAMSAHHIDTEAFQSRWLSIWKDADGGWHYGRQFMRRPGYTGVLDSALSAPVARQASQDAMQLLHEVMPQEEWDLAQSPPYRVLAEVLLDG